MKKLIYSTGENETKAVDATSGEQKVKNEIEELSKKHFSTTAEANEFILKKLQELDGTSSDVSSNKTTWIILGIIAVVIFFYFKNKKKA